MKSYLSRLMLLTLGVTVAAANPASAQENNWSQWRGPNFNGSSEAKNLPETFSKTENLLWSATLPGISNSTPIVHGDRVYTVAVDGSKKLLAMCLSKADGKVIWQKDVGVGFFARGENNMATPSPVTDGKHVWF